MNRRRVMACLAAGLLTLGPMVAPVMAQDIGDVLVAQLRDQGFAVQSLETTWLGRLRILATRGGGQREIIVNPRTGEILRDIFTGHSGGATILDPVARNSGGTSGGGSGKGSVKGSDGGSQDPDDSSDDDRDYNSGSGGSGGGSSGSGSDGSSGDDGDEDSEDGGSGKDSDGGGDDDKDSGKDSSDDKDED